ncbi:MAG: B12-binding domain-containing radical SAM protein, partial [Candidatus Muiribacteriota bacterium]
MTGSVKDLLSVEKPSRYFPFELGRADKKWDNKKLSFCLSYPDSYEIGMSNLGLRIIYSLLNSFEKVVCDRIFCPFSDMEEKYKNQNYDFTSIEHNKKLNEFDVLGFTFQYELLYTNFLTILNLGSIDFDKSKRNDEQPIIIAGGPAMFNPAIMRKFADFIFVGEAEQSLKIFTEYLIDFKNKNASRSYIIQNMPEIEGVLNTHKPSKVKRTWVEDFENCFFPDKWLVPLSSITHDRIFLEIMRGCPHGCRFCQAGFLYRPLRYRSVEKLKNIADKL